MNKKTSRIIYIIIGSLLSYIGITNYFKISNYNFLSLCIFILLIISFYKTKNTLDKRNNITSIILSILFAIFIIVGDVLKGNAWLYIVDFTYHLFTFSNFLSLVGLFFVFNLLINNMFMFINKTKITSKKVFDNKKLFLISFSIIFVGWFIYFLSLYPGILTSDSINEFEQIYNGLHIISDHHPVFHVLFMYLPFKLGTLFSNNINVCVCFVTIFQMICMDLIFCYFINFLNKLKINKIIIILITIFFALSPIFGYMAVTLWKDVIFGGVILLLSVYLLNMFYIKKGIILKDYIILYLILMAMCLFRNNGVYILLILVPFMLIAFKKYIKKLIILFLVVISSFLIIKGPIYNSLGIRKSSSSEYIGLPIQQISRIVIKNGNINEEEKALIEKLMTYENIRLSYSYISSDGIKFSPNFHVEEFDKNKLEYLKLYISLVLKNPLDSIEAYLIFNLGYWYPDIEYWSVVNTSIDNSLGIKNSSKSLPVIDKLIFMLKDKNTSFVGYSWSIGLMVYIMIGSLAYSIANKKKNYLTYIPVIGVWITLLIATPVYAEFRYFFSGFTCSILFIILMFVDLKKEK